jgi:hypothetical protein
MNMILETAREAFSLIRTYPVIILPGIIIGILSFLEMVLTFSIDAFYADFLRVFQVFLIPFLIAGVYGVIKKRDPGFIGFFEEGVRYYFRVLMPTILILFVVLITTFLVLIPLAILGLAEDMSISLVVLLGVLLSIGMFTFFYDTAAVFEDRKVFDSILRSVSVVSGRFIPCLLFYLLLVGLIILIFLGATMVLSLLLSGPLEPLLQMSQAELELLTPSDILSLIGEEGILVMSMVYIIALGLFATLLYPLKAAFFLRITREFEEPTVILPQGEYDDKGRYYKY